VEEIVVEEIVVEEIVAETTDESTGTAPDGAR